MVLNLRLENDYIVIRICGLHKQGGVQLVWHDIFGWLLWRLNLGRLI